MKLELGNVCCYTYYSKSSTYVLLLVVVVSVQVKTRVGHKLRFINNKKINISSLEYIFKIGYFLQDICLMNTVRVYLDTRKSA